MKRKHGTIDFPLSPTDMETAIDGVIDAVMPFNRSPVRSETEIAPRIHVGDDFWRRVRNAHAKDDVVRRAVAEMWRRGWLVRSGEYLGLSHEAENRWRRRFGAPLLPKPRKYTW